MLFTATTTLAFILIGVLAVAAGHFSRRHELYIFGVVLIFFMGLNILSDGMAVQTGILINETDTPGPSNVTQIDAHHVYEFDQTTDAWTNGLGLLCVVIAAGLAMTWFQERKKERVAREQSVDLDE